MGEIVWHCLLARRAIRVQCTCNGSIVGIVIRYCSDGSHKVVLAYHDISYYARRYSTGMPENGRHFNRIVVHIYRIGAIAFAPKAVVAAAKAVVASKDHQGVFVNSSFF